jgi:hypothetical protein
MAGRSNESKSEGAESLLLPLQRKVSTRTEKAQWAALEYLAGAGKVLKVRLPQC